MVVFAEGLDKSEQVREGSRVVIVTIFSCNGNDRILLIPVLLLPKQEKIVSGLKVVAEERKAAEQAGFAKPLSFLVATDIDQMSQAIRKLCNLDEIQGGPA